MIYKSISFSKQEKPNYLLKNVIRKKKQLSLCLRFCCIVAKRVSGALRVKLQADSNILASPEAVGVIAYLMY